MKSKIIALISVILALAVTAGGIVYASDNGKASDGTAGQNGTENELPGVPELISATADGTVAKEETVYIFTSADGSAEKTVVSDHIVNGAAADEIEDVTTLKDVYTLGGDVAFSEGKDGARVWKANGRDVSYQGTTDAEAPVKMKVTYRLNGDEITPEELAGKSGKVTVRFDFENTAYAIKKVNGSDRKVYIPYAAVTGLILDNEIFSGVAVKNGRAINDGSRTIVAGLALPGMQETLGLDVGDIELPSYFEITAYASGFKLGMTVTLVTDRLFTELDGGLFDKTEGISDSLAQLTDAMGKLLDGAKQLSDGLVALYGKTGELADGVGKLASGASALNKGAAGLSDGASKLSGGAKQLSDGLGALASKNDELTGGALQVFNGLLNTASEQLSASGLDVPALTVGNYAKTLNGVIASLDETSVYDQALKAVTAGVEAKRGYIEEQVAAAVRAEVEKGVTAAVREQVAAGVTAAVRSNVEEKVAAAVRAGVEAKVAAAVREDVRGKVIRSATGMEPSAYDAAVEAGAVDEAVQAAVSSAVEAQMATDEVKAAIAKNTDAQMATDEVKATIEKNTDAQMSSDEVKAAVENNTDARMETEDIKSTVKSNVDEQMKSEKIKNLIASNVEAQIEKAISETMAGEEVQSKLKAASEGAKKVISLKASLDGYNAFYLGLKAYTDGVAEAAKGAASLKSGSVSLADGAKKLASGASDLNKGAAALNDAMPALTEGVGKLNDGAAALSAGLSEFNSKGIQKLTSLLDKNVGGVVDALRAATEAAKETRGFVGIADSMDGTVKFIYRTAEIGE